MKIQNVSPLIVPSIPKLIMQTWKTKDIPKVWIESPESIKKNLPDWKYVLMTDEDNRNFIKTYFPDFLSYYDAFPYNIQRADAIRPCWLYIHGGVYMDLDYAVIKPLDSLFKKHYDIYLAKSGSISTHFNNSFMASKPKHPFWLDYIEEMKKPKPWWAIGKHLTVYTTTGPFCLTKIISKWKNNIYYLNEKQINPCSVCNITCDIKDSYLRPLKGQSWNSFDSYFYNFLLCNWIKIIIFIIVIIFIFLFFFKKIKSNSIFWENGAKK